MIRINPILATDSYKFSHKAVMPSNVTAASAYIEARTNGRDVIVPFGYAFLQGFLSSGFDEYDIDEAEKFLAKHGEPFDRAAFEYILEKYSGFWPVNISAVPEGTPVQSGNVIMRITSTDPKCAWVVSFLETIIQRAVWYPTTIASRSYKFKRMLRHYLAEAGNDLSAADFMLHDFGARGVSSQESAILAGAAHLTSFKGSDNLEAVYALNEYYDSEMSAFSVPASEHSVETAYGSSVHGERAYIKAMLDAYAKPGAIVSIVVDGYDTFRAVEEICTTFKDRIIASGAKIVVRPDSGDMMVVVPRILQRLQLAFGCVHTSKGYMVLQHVGVLQGDGISYESAEQLLNLIMNFGFAPSNLVFGSGGWLLQNVTRDTFKFAQKLSAVKLGDTNVWTPVSKDPITDPGKKSKAGYLTLSRLDGKLTTTVEDYERDVLVTIYGQISVKWHFSTLDEIRARIDNSF